MTVERQASDSVPDLALCLVLIALLGTYSTVHVPSLCLLMLMGAAPQISALLLPNQNI